MPTKKTEEADIMPEEHRFKRAEEDIQDLWGQIEALKKPNYTLISIAVIVLVACIGWVQSSVVSTADLKDAKIDFERQNHNIQLELKDIKLLIVESKSK